MRRSSRQSFGGHSLLLFSIVATTLASSSSSTRRECVDISSSNELQQHIANAHVLVWVGASGNDNDDNDDDNDGDEAYDELCQRYANSPAERTKDFVIAKLTNNDNAADLQTKLLSQSKSPPAVGILQRLMAMIAMFSSTEKSTTDASSSEYILFRKGEISSISSLEGIHFVPAGDTNNDEPTTAATKTADDVSNFVSSQLQRKKIGNFVYSLSTFDLIAAMVMKSISSSDNDTNSGGLSSVQSYAWASTATILAWLQRWNPSNSNQMAFNAELSESYAKTSWKVVWEQQTTSPSAILVRYPQRQVSRLESMLERDGTHISDMKKEELQQRIYTLTKFTEPMDVTDQDVRHFVGKTALNGAIWIVLIVLVLYVLVSNDDGEEEEKEEADETTMGVDGNGNVDDDDHDDDDSPQEDKKDQ